MLVHVHPWLVEEAAESELARRGWEATAQARDILAAATVGASVHVLMGDAGEQIVRMGEGRDISGIVIGSRGLSAAGSLLLGSIAYQVVHRSTVPVMIMR